MSLATNRRESILKPVAHNTPVPAATLRFQWSRSAAHFTSNDENTSMMIPSIETDRSSQKTMSSSSSSFLDQTSNNSSPQSSRKSFTLPHISKQCRSPRSTTNKNTVLSLDYNQLYRESAAHHAAKRDQHTRFALYLISDSPQNSLVNGMKRKQSNKPRQSIVSRPSIPSGTDVSFSSSILPNKSSQENFIRLKTAELRRMNVSEKYLNEARTLYFNVKCRSFIPRVALTQVV